MVFVVLLLVFDYLVMSDIKCFITVMSRLSYGIDPDFLVGKVVLHCKNAYL